MSQRPAATVLFEVHDRDGQRPPPFPVSVPASLLNPVGGLGKCVVTACTWVMITVGEAHTLETAVRHAVPQSVQTRFAVSMPPSNVAQTKRRYLDCVCTAEVTRRASCCCWCKSCSALGTKEASVSGAAFSFFGRGIASLARINNHPQPLYVSLYMIAVLPAAERGCRYYFFPPPLHHCPVI